MRDASAWRVGERKQNRNGFKLTFVERQRGLDEDAARLEEEELALLITLYQTRDETDDAPRTSAGALGVLTTKKYMRPVDSYEPKFSQRTSS